METMNAILKRKSTRAYSPEKQISKDDLEKILAAACAAPVGMADYESLHLTVVQKPEALLAIKKEEYEALITDRDILYNAPVFIIVSASEKQKAMHIHNANAACIIENMLIAAADLGIDSVYLWGAAKAIAGSEKLCKMLNIPKGFKPTSGAVFGYAADNFIHEKRPEKTFSINYV